MKKIIDILEGIVFVTVFVALFLYMFLGASYKYQVNQENRFTEVSNYE